jgi:hypothetical protein
MVHLSAKYIINTKRRRGNAPTLLSALGVLFSTKLVSITAEPTAANKKAGTRRGSQTYGLANRNQNIRRDPPAINES